MRNGFKMLIAFLIAAVLGLLYFGQADKIKADAYICGEPPDEVTYYCAPGTGPPRADCGAAQTGEFDIDNTTIC